MNLHVAPTPGRAEKAVYASRAPAAGKVAHKAARIGELGEHRVYRPGDDPRRIDYRRSAKSQELLLRESLDQSLDSARFALPDASDPRLEQKLQDICAASVQRQSQGLAFSYLRGDEPVYSAQQSLRSPRQAFQILATHASQAA